MNFTETDLINAQIDYFGRGRTNKDIAQSILNDWRNSKTLNDMIDAEEYYMCRNTTISDKKRDIPSNDKLSNTRIPSGHLRSNVLQKINYSLGKPFLLSVEAPDDNDELKQIYIDEWNKYLTPEVRSTLKRIAKEAINKGIGWAYVTIEDGELKIIDNVSNEIYPAWTDRAHKELDVIVRDYIQIEYTNNKRNEIKKVEYWDKDIVETYTDNGNLIPVSINPHMEYGGKDISWNKLPFVALKGNDDELPLLNVIRQLIDAYDALQSKTVDALLDDIDPVLAIEGMSPDIEDITKARRLVKNSRVMTVEKEGSVYYVQSNTDTTSIQQILEFLKKNMREDGQSVDSQDIKFGSNPSGVALKSMYQDIDIYTNGFEVEIEVFWQNIKYFFDIWLEFRGIGTSDLWDKYKISLTLDRDMMINESAIIDDTVKLMQTGVSQETIDLYNPAVESPQIENARREAEREADIKQQQNHNDLFKFINESNKMDDDLEEAI